MPKDAIPGGGEGKSPGREKGVASFGTGALGSRLCAEDLITHAFEGLAPLQEAHIGKCLHPTGPVRREAGIMFSLSAPAGGEVGVVKLL